MKQNVRLLIESVIVFGLVFILTVSNIFSPLDYILKDALYQTPRGVTSQIKIVAIDERTLEALGPINTWSREVYAQLLSRLNAEEEAKPLVIGFDIVFSGQAQQEVIRLRMWYFHTRHCGMRFRSDIPMWHRIRTERSVG